MIIFDNTYTVTIHAGAVYRYYESRRRLHNDSADQRESAVRSNEKTTKKRRTQKKVVSIIHAASTTNYQCLPQLYMQRSTVLKTKERKYWDEIDYRYMTDESDGELDGKTIKETHRPSWRSSGECKLNYKIFNGRNLCNLYHGNIDI